MLQLYEDYWINKQQRKNVESVNWKMLGKIMVKSNLGCYVNKMI